MADSSHHRRAQGRSSPPAPAGGRQAALLRFASTVGNRRMVQIARQGVLGQAMGWHDPFAEWRDEEQATLPPGLDLSFLDEQEEPEQPLPPGLDLSFLDDEAPRPVTAPARTTPPALATPPVTTPAVTTPPALATPPVTTPAVTTPPVVTAPPATTAPATTPSRAAEVTALVAESQIKLLTRKVDELLGANSVTVHAGARYKLSYGATVEVPMTVRDKGTNAPLTTFVVHYHPGASGAAVGSAAASKWHIKKWANAQKHNREDNVSSSTHPNLIKLIPRFRDATHNWQSLPVGGLYKPKAKK